MPNSPHSNTPSLENVIDIRVIRNGRSNLVRDYTMDRMAAMELVVQLTKFYHSKGHTHVKVWIEPQHLDSGRKYYNIRSNISFRVPE